MTFFAKSAGETYSTFELEYFFRFNEMCAQAKRKSVDMLQCRQSVRRLCLSISCIEFFSRDGDNIQSTLLQFAIADEYIGIVKQSHNLCDTNAARHNTHMHTHTHRHTRHNKSPNIISSIYDFTAVNIICTSFNSNVKQTFEMRQKLLIYFI